MKKKYKNLLQRQYAKTSLKGFNEISTFPIWTSFITGKMPEEHGIITQIKSDHVGNFLKAMKKVLHLKKRFGLTKKLVRLGLTSLEWNKTDIKVETIFDRIPNSIAINVPGYSKKLTKAALSHERILELLEKNRDYEIRESVWVMTEKIAKETKKRMHEDYGLLMAHFWTMDYFGHYFIGDKETMDFAHRRVDDMVGEFQEIASDGLFLIVSDHGMKLIEKQFGEHSDYGFCSTNIYMPKLHNLHITEFADLIYEYYQRD